MGLAVTNRLIELGWSITIVDFNQERGEEVAKKYGSRILFVQGNVAIWDQLSDAFVRSWKQWGRLDFGTKSPSTSGFSDARQFLQMR